MSRSIETPPTITEELPHNFHDRLTHLDERGQAHMVDVTDKAASQREAIAEAWLRMKPETLRGLESGGHPKGDVFAVARVAGIMAAKRCQELIPLCHPLLLTAISVDIKAVQPDSVRVVARCALNAPTGVEMEALTAASIAALTLYDMCKAVDRGMQIDWVRLLKKDGGRSGRYSFGEAQ